MRDRLIVLGLIIFTVFAAGVAITHRALGTEAEPLPVTPATSAQPTRETPPAQPLDVRTIADPAACTTTKIKETCCHVACIVTERRSDRDGTASLKLCVDTLACEAATLDVTQVCGCRHGLR